MAERERKGRGDAEGPTGAGQEARPDQKPSRTHESGYGGRGGEPKTSSDQREPNEPTGKEPA
ncbi:MAG TPA: hypothetical protein VK922_00120 [Gemmatimonadaceae bacterium]|nr:hypothetical protein [Gemmatimonadaceae bacterium]